VTERRPISFSGPWTGPAVRDRVAEAALALRTASVGRQHPLERWTNWPLIAVDRAEEAYGYTETKPRPIRASAAAISRMDEVLDWISKWLSVDWCVRHGLADDAQTIIWLRASGRSWAWIGAKRHEVWHAKGQRPPRGNSRPILGEIEARALRFVANELNLARVEFREAKELPDHDRRDVREKLEDQGASV
jgi:hypothetical protein